MKLKNRVGHFGPLVKHYEKARRPYPKEVFYFLKRNIPNKSAILDLGCGTGISTRQLTKLGQVIGCDPDPVMLGVARKSRTKNKEKYVLGSSERLPFETGTFDAVTAFSAFHWFDNKKSISEIKRVLKPNGVFFVVNKVGTKNWGEGYRRAIAKAIGQDVAHFQGKTQYDPVGLLKKNGFRKVRAKNWSKSEIYKLNDALNYVQSVSIWNSVPAQLKGKALEGLIKYFQEIKRRKKRIERKLKARVVIALK
jgi:ubiquinone/menaquinone biosynthesis C-methylase UbiE